MTVDKSLFLYDLAVVAILKNEGLYVKEWLDYHLLAGVNHFYIYDNESPDNLKEVLQPYIEKNIVTYIFYPGRAKQYEAYNDAVKNYKFFCRYMAFIDGDEFIFPRNNQTITEVVDEILSDKSDAAALGVNWYFFGSNFQKTADLTRGVLERFTRRDSEINKHIKTILNPRRVKYIGNAHFAYYFYDFFCFGENGEKIPGPFNEQGSAEKISVNHYHTKSFEEYIKRCSQGKADNPISRLNADLQRYLKGFKDSDKNEIFDSGALKYFLTRQKNLLANGGDFFENLAPYTQVDEKKILNTLIQNLNPAFSENTSPEFFRGKTENFLTCRALVSYLREKSLNEYTANFFEESALNALYGSLVLGSSLLDVQILLAELPKILPLKYPVVEKIRQACIEIIPQIMEIFRLPHDMVWKEFTDLQYTLDLLKAN